MVAWRQMEALHDAGLVRNLGMSNMTIPKLEAVLPLCRIKPTLIEMELHPSFQQEELYNYCMEKGFRLSVSVLWVLPNVLNAIALMMTSLILKCLNL